MLELVFGIRLYKVYLQKICDEVSIHTASRYLHQRYGIFMLLINTQINNQFKNVYTTSKKDAIALL